MIRHQASLVSAEENTREVNVDFDSQLLSSFLAQFSPLLLELVGFFIEVSTFAGDGADEFGLVGREVWKVLGSFCVLNLALR